MLKRRRFKQAKSFKDRLSDWAEKLREQAARLPPGTSGMGCSREQVRPTQRRILTTGPTRRACALRHKGARRGRPPIGRATISI
jgi:hypothetical protein